MAISRIYHLGELASNTTIQLDKAASHHLVRVLRHKTDDRLILFNGNGLEYSAIITNNNQKKCSVNIEQQYCCDNESTLNITLLQGVSRNDRMDSCIQKATELGVKRIIPFTSQRTSAHASGARKEKKQDHWQRVSISACEQSGRCILPIIDKITDYKTVISTAPQKTRLLLDPQSDLSLKQLSDPDSDICILIGPESGFTQDEIKLAQSYGFSALRFGRRVLRTETAGPAFISALQTLWGDMG